MSEGIVNVLQSRKRQPLAEMVNESIEEHELRLKSLLERKQAEREDPLDHHSIRPSLRARMADWMIEIVASFNLKHRTYFLAVNLLDIFLKETQKEYSNTELHLIGVACMVISSKFNDTRYLTIQMAERHISNGELTQSSIVEMEKEIFVLINRHVGMVTVYDLIRVLCDKYKVAPEVKRTSITILYLLQMYYDAIGLSVPDQAFAAFILSLQTLEQRSLIDEVKSRGECQVEVKHIESALNAVLRFKGCFPSFTNPMRFLDFEFARPEDTQLFVLKTSERFK